MARFASCIVAALTVLLPTGCVEEKDCPECICPTCKQCPAPEVFVGYICMPDGMYLDGKKMVSTDPIHFVESPCGEAAFEIAGDGYRACCDDTCCEWHPNDPTYPLEPYAECDTDEDCAFGLTCKPVASPTGEKVGKCSYGKAGDPCDYSHFCESDLFCNQKKLECQQRVQEEGQYCDAEIQNCQLPMKCLCGTGEPGCRCFDGSENDPCDEASCQAGLYCVKPLSLSPDAGCYDGSLGDPCSWDVQCTGQLSCEPEEDGLRCHAWLLAGVACDESAGPHASCHKGLVCNGAFGKPVCASPGIEGAACVMDLDCAEGLHCVTAQGKCHDGSEGDPCVSDADCGPALRCLASVSKCYDGSVGDPCHPNFCSVGTYCWDTGEGETGGQCLDGVKGDPCSGPGECNEPLLCATAEVGTFCLEVGIEGQTCSADPSVLYVVCGEGLVCNTFQDPPVCLPPGQVGGACKSSADCEPGLSCVALLEMCSDGMEGSACDLDFACADGLACIPSKGTCHDGNEGDPCDDGTCMEGLVCVASDGGCHDGNEGDPCDETSCVEGLGCVNGICGQGQ